MPDAAPPAMVTLKDAARNQFYFCYCIRALRLYPSRPSRGLPRGQRVLLKLKSPEGCCVMSHAFDPMRKVRARAAVSRAAIETLETRRLLASPQLLDPVQPIVSGELWKECNAFLDSNDLGRRRGRKAIHLFAGFALCHGGRRMYVRTHSQDYRCSACGNRIAAYDLEAIFVEQIKDYPPLATGEGPHELHDCWPSLKASEKRRVIEGLVERIVVGQDDIDITLCSPPNAIPLGPQELSVTDKQPAVSLPATQASEPPANGSSPAEPRVDPIALAIAFMKDHPEWSARKLAQAAGCSHTTLTRSPLFRTAKALAGAKQSRPQGWRLPDGRIEARDDDAGCP